MKEEGFLEYINQLLMTGEVAGLLPKEELDALLNDVRPAFKRENIGVPFAAPWHLPGLTCSCIEEDQHLPAVLNPPEDNDGVSWHCKREG